MKFYKAKVVDVIRSQQRDETFTSELNVQVDSLIKLLGLKFYNQHRHNVQMLTRIWYYLLTSGSNLQTLGEEYAGILRVVSGNNVPTKWRQILWLTLYVGGENLFKRFLRKVLSNVKQSTSIMEDPKKRFTQMLSFLIDNQEILMRLHQAFFYIFGAFYNVSNRLLEIRYVLLRDWMQDQTSTRSINFLGHCYLLYLIIYLCKYKANEDMQELDIPVITSNGRNCSLCGEDRKNTAATPCGHLYCWECIYKCIKFSPYCPTCRESLISSRIVYLQNYK